MCIHFKNCHFIDIKAALLILHAACPIHQTLFVKGLQDPGWNRNEVWRDILWHTQNIVLGQEEVPNSCLSLSWTLRRQIQPQLLSFLSTMITLLHTAQDIVKWNEQQWLRIGSDRSDTNKEKTEKLNCWERGEKEKQMENAKLELEGGSKRGIKAEREREGVWVKEKSRLRGQGQENKNILSFFLTVDCIRIVTQASGYAVWILGGLLRDICSTRRLVLKNIPANALVLTVLGNDTITMSYVRY